jgi:ABC-type antimicrobial peptide transport system permease subunit
VPSNLGSGPPSRNHPRPQRSCSPAAHVNRLATAGGLGGIGVGIGLVAALAASRMVGAFLFGLAAWDPITYVAVTVAVLLVVAGATLVPLRRVANLAPADVLRHE